MQPVAVPAIDGLHTAATLHQQAGQRFLPLTSPLVPLMPAGGLRRGTVVNIDRTAPGSTSLIIALLAEASKAGSWCAIIGKPDLGYVAAAEYGIALDRLAIVPRPGPQWREVVAAMIDGFDIVVIESPERLAPTAVQQFAARARQRGTVIVPFGQAWDAAETHLEIIESTWYGIGEGSGRKVVVEGRRRGMHDAGRRIEMWLPRPGERWMPPVEEAEPRRLRSVR